jgi:hypothetical protein
MPLRHRHGYAADIHRDLSTSDMEPIKEFATHIAVRVCTAAQPRSVRFELVGLS